jgi:predicted tellurium resistance membrane protein TerC
MAMAMRLVMIFLGAELVDRFSLGCFILPGRFLFYTAIKLFGEGEHSTPKEAASCVLPHAS